MNASIASAFMATPSSSIKARIGSKFMRTPGIWFVTAASAIFQRSSSPSRHSPATSGKPLGAGQREGNLPHRRERVGADAQEVAQIGDVDVERAQHADQVLQRLFELGRRVPEIVAAEQVVEQGADVAAACREGRGKLIDQRIGRSIADEAAGDLGADEVRRRGMSCQQVEHGFAVLLAAADRDGRAEDGFGVDYRGTAAETDS